MSLTVPFMEWQSRRIKAARAMRNKSAQQVADALEVSLTQYKRGESNARRWKPGELLMIARFLAVPDAWLLHETYDPFAVTTSPAQSTAEPDARTSPDTLARKDMLDTQPRPVRSEGFESTETPPADPHESQG